MMQRAPSNIRVYLNRIVVIVEAWEMRHYKSIKLNEGDDLSNIDIMRRYIREAIEIRNVLKTGDSTVADDEMPTDEVIYGMFDNYERKPPKVVRTDQPHESTIAAKRDVSNVLQRYGLL